MRRSAIVFFVSLACYGQDISNIYFLGSADNCSAQQRSSANLPCDPQAFHYNHDLDTLFGRGTSINYDLKKNPDNDTVSIAANYKNNGLSGQLQANYKKDILHDQTMNGSAQMFIQYRAKASDNLTLGVSERFVVPLLDNQDDPYYLISSFHSDYSLNDSYNIFVQNSYTSFVNLHEPYASSVNNPYTITTGLSYTDGSSTLLKASYSQYVYKDKTQSPDEYVRVLLKQKINRSIQTKLQVSKNVSSAKPDERAFINFNYKF